MQQFDDLKGIRRLIIISNMKPEEVDELYFQVSNIKDITRTQLIRALKKRIKGLQQQKESKEWILVIKEVGSNKVIGKIEVMCLGENKAFLKINMPNEVYSYKYGVRAIKQFIKICSENNYFESILLNSGDIISERYRNSYDIEKLPVKVSFA